MQLPKSSHLSYTSHRKSTSSPSLTITLETAPPAPAALSCLRGAAAVSPRYSPPCESAAALTGGEYLCLGSFVWLEACLRVERDDLAKQKVSVLLELQS